MSPGQVGKHFLCGKIRCKFLPSGKQASLITVTGFQRGNRQAHVSIPWRGRKSSLECSEQLLWLTHSHSKHPAWHSPSHPKALPSPWRWPRRGFALEESTAEKHCGVQVSGGGKGDGGALSRDSSGKWVAENSYTFLDRLALLATSTCAWLSGCCLKGTESSDGKIRNRDSKQHVAAV